MVVEPGSDPPSLPLHIETIGPDAGPHTETFVLVHGFGASMFSWRKWAPGLATRGHVIEVDMKGFGNAPQPDDGRYAPRDLADGIFELVERHAPTRLCLVGHSLGGGIVLLTALRMIDEGVQGLGRLILVAGAAYEQRLPPFVWLADRPRLSRLLLRAVGPDRLVRTVLRMIVHDKSSVTSEQVQGYAEPLRRPGSAGVLISAAQQIVPEDLDRLALRYPEIDVPTLLIWGREDPVVPLSVGERLHAALPSARLCVLEGCGHLPAEEQPDASYALVERFLDETGPPGG